MSLRKSLLLAALFLLTGFSLSCQNAGGSSSMDMPAQAIASGFLSDRSRNGVPVSKTKEDAQPIGRDTPVHSDNSWTVVPERTPCEVLRTEGDFAFVRVSSGDKAGAEGWVYKNQVLSEIEDAPGY